MNKQLCDVPSSYWESINNQTLDEILNILNLKQKYEEHKEYKGKVFKDYNKSF